MQVDVKAYPVKRGVLPVVFYVLAVLTWLGALPIAAQMSGAMVVVALAAEIIVGFLFAGFGRIIEGVSETSYLTALIAQRMMDGRSARDQFNNVENFNGNVKPLTPEGSPSAQTPPGLPR